jgi:hypothetical protein
MQGNCAYAGSYAAYKFGNSFKSAKSAIKME